jgi:palmitoyltransferase
MILFSLVIVAQLLFVIPSHKDALWGYLTVGGGFCALVSFFWASCSNPGYLKPEHRFEDLLKEVHPCEMCPDCEVIRSSRSKHCAICNHCVERYDHHCPWINNCVGTGNHNAFLSFIYSMTVTLTIIIISSGLGFDSKVYDRHPDQWTKWQ